MRDVGDMNGLLYTAWGECSDDYMRLKTLMLCNLAESHSGELIIDAMGAWHLGSSPGLPV